MNSIRSFLDTLVIFVITAFIMLPWATPVVYAADSDRPVSVNDPSLYTDLYDSWASAALANMVSNGIMTGRTDTTIDPDTNITRAEMAALMVRILEPTSMESLESFKDMSPEMWHYEVVSKAVSLGLLQGSGNEMHPNDLITKQEAAVIFTRAFNLYGYSHDLTEFSDYDDIASWAREDMSACVGAGIVKPTSSNELLPQKELSRAEFAYMVHNLISSYSSSKVNSVSEQNPGAILVSNLAPVISNATPSRDVFIVGGVGDTAVELDNIVCSGTVYVLAGNSLTISGESDIANIVLNSPFAKRVEVELGSSVGNLIVQECGENTVEVSGDFNSIEVESDQTPISISNSAVKTLRLVESEAKVEVDEFSSIDKVIGTADFADGNLSADQNIIKFENGGAVESIQLTNYNPLQMRKDYEREVSDFATNLGLNVDENKVTASGEFEKITFSSEEVKNQTAYYLPVRLKMSGVQERYSVKINTFTQDDLPSISTDGEVFLNILVPFTAKQRSATVEILVPGNKDVTASTFTITLDKDVILK